MAGDGVRSGLHDEKLDALGRHLEMAFELYVNQVRDGWRGRVEQPGELPGQIDDDGDGGGKTKTSTRIVQAKWLGANCGDIKPFTPPGAPK